MKSVDISAETTIHVKLLSENAWDETVIGFHQDARPQFDKKLDAFKFYSGNEALLGIATVADHLDTANSGDPVNFDQLSISMWPIPEDDLSIDLFIRKGSQTEMTLVNDMVDSFDDNMCLILQDKELGNTVSFNQGESYTFEMNPESSATRFSILVSAPLQSEVVSESCENENDGEAIAFGFGSAPWDFHWRNASGDTIRSTIESYAPDTIQNLPPGFYEVIVTNNAESCTSAEKLVIIEPAPEEWADYAVLATSCYDVNEAAVQLKLAPQYDWDVRLNDEQSSPLHECQSYTGDTTFTGLPAGTLTIDLTSNCGNKLTIPWIQTTSPKA
ncbi:MAG: hypothetical protein HKN32_03745, partial [Flavobacteriales bacterium]|nr:hypothetical protein [Flavobacteriales bacterium]